MQYKKGQELYDYTADSDGTITPWLYVVRTIRGGWVYAILKESYTWGYPMVFGKSGGKRWLDPLPAWTRIRTRQGHKFYSRHTTKRQALVALRKDITGNDYGDYSLEVKKRLLTNIKRQLTRIKKGGK